MQAKNMKADFPAVPITEQENPRTSNLSSLPVAEIVNLMNEEDALVAKAVQSVLPQVVQAVEGIDRKSTRLNSSHGYISYAVFCFKKKKILGQPTAMLNVSRQQSSVR